MVAVNRSRLRDIEARLAEAAALEVRLGVMGPNGGPTGAHPEGDGLSIADVAAIHEHGTDTLPARPIVRGYLANGGQAELARDQAEAIRRVIEQGEDPRRALQAVADEHGRKMRERFDRGIGPAIDVEHDEGSHVPLHDTGAIANAIRGAVVGV